MVAIVAARQSLAGDEQIFEGVEALPFLPKSGVRHKFTKCGGFITSKGPNAIPSVEEPVLLESLK